MPADERGMTMNEKMYHSFSDSEFGLLNVFQFGDKFWFPASECAKMLGYYNPRQAVKRHCTGHGVSKRDVRYPYKYADGKVSEITRSTNLIDDSHIYHHHLLDKIYIYNILLPVSNPVSIKG